MDDKLEVRLEGDTLVEKLAKYLNASELSRLKSLPPCSISSGIKLAEAIGTSRANAVMRKALYYPEIATDGKRRCVYVYENSRCCNYNDIPTCERHYERATVLSPSTFKNKSVRNAYARHLANPRKLQADSELAVMRTMLEVLIRKCGDSDTLPLEQVAGIASLSDKITVIVERMNKMNEITPEKVEAMMSKVVDIIAEYVHPDKLKECAEKIGKVGTSLPNCEIPYLPGNTLELEDSMGVNTDETVTTVTQRAMIEVAVQMGIQDNGN